MKITRNMKMTFAGMAIVLVIVLATCLLLWRSNPPGNNEPTDENVEALLKIIHTDVRERQKRLLHGTDHQALLEACRELSSRVAVGDLEAARHDIFRNPDLEPGRFPQTILDLEPTCVYVDKEATVTVEMGGFYQHFGVTAYAEDCAMSPDFQYRGRKLIDGLWYYDDGPISPADLLADTGGDANSHREFMDLMWRDALRRRVRLLYQTDHQTLLKACRELSRRVAARDLKAGTYRVRLDRHPEATRFPQAILDLDPVYVNVQVDGTVLVGMRGGIDHFGVHAYPGDFQEPLYLKNGDRKLINGLWYYDDGLRHDPNYWEYLESMRPQTKTLS
jgi:hypothetical protein